MINESKLSMERFFTASARGFVEAQMALDEHGRASIIAWEQDGLPPTVWTWSDCRLRFSVSFRCTPKTSAGGQADLAVAPRRDNLGKIVFTFRYVLTPQDEDEPVSHV